MAAQNKYQVKCAGMHGVSLSLQVHTLQQQKERNETEGQGWREGELRREGDTHQNPERDSVNKGSSSSAKCVQAAAKAAKGKGKPN